MNEVKCLHGVFLEQSNIDSLFDHEQERLSNMNLLLKRLLENTQTFDTR